MIEEGPKFTIIDSIKTYLCVAGECFLSNNIDWEIIVNEEGDKILKGTKK